jgi:hypothetical protein
MESRELAARALSPELVLVDPELAAEARAALPEHPWPAPVRIEPPPRRASRIRGVAAAAAWTFVPVLAIVLLVFGLTLVSTADRPTLAAEGERNRAALPATRIAPASRPTAPQATKPPTTKPKAAPKRAERTRPTRTGARSRPNTKPAATPKAEANARAPRRPPRTRRPSRSGFRPARVFSWPPRAGAAHYQVAFLRNGRPFYRTQTQTARLRLPDRVRFTAGRYRWTVRPALAADSGIRLGNPIVDSTFQVSGD